MYFLSLTNHSCWLQRTQRSSSLIITLSIITAVRGTQSKDGDRNSSEHHHMSAPDQASPVSCSTALQGLHQQQSKGRKKENNHHIYIVLQTRKTRLFETVGSLHKNKVHFLSNTVNFTNRLQAKELGNQSLCKGFQAQTFWSHYCCFLIPISVSAAALLVTK